MHIICGPTGSVVKGHVLDVSVKPFEQALKDYDPLLYVKWQPKKLKGWGCWQIRRKNPNLEPMEVVNYKGMSIIRLAHDEIDMNNLILEVAFLNYSQLNKIKEMDTWNKSHMVHHIDYLEQKGKEERQLKAAEDMRHAAKEYKREIRDFKEMVLSGHNPADIAIHWNKK